MVDAWWPAAAMPLHLSVGVVLGGQQHGDQLQALVRTYRGKAQKLCYYLHTYGPLPLALASTITRIRRAGPVAIELHATAPPALVIERARCSRPALRLAPARPPPLAPQLVLEEEVAPPLAGSAGADQAEPVAAISAGRAASASQQATLHTGCNGRPTTAPLGSTSALEEAAAAAAASAPTGSDGGGTSGRKAGEAVVERSQGGHGSRQAPGPTPQPPQPQALQLVLEEEEAAAAPPAAADDAAPASCSARQGAAAEGASGGGSLSSGKQATYASDMDHTLLLPPPPPPPPLIMPPRSSLQQVASSPQATGRVAAYLGGPSKSGTVKAAAAAAAAPAWGSGRADGAARCSPEALAALGLRQVGNVAAARGWMERMAARGGGGGGA